MQVTNMRSGKRVRVGRIVRMHADKREDIEAVYAGGIAAVIGIEAKTGDTLCDSHHPIILENLDIPPAVVTLAIEPRTTGRTSPGDHC
jgi:elongation factor G